MFVHGPATLVARCTAYLSFVAPPLPDGAAQVSAIDPLPGVELSDCGAVGTVLGFALTAAVAGPQPTLLWATIRK